MNKKHVFIVVVVAAAAIAAAVVVVVVAAAIAAAVVVVVVVAAATAAAAIYEKGNKLFIINQNRDFSSSVSCISIPISPFSRDGDDVLVLSRYRNKSNFL